MERKRARLSITSLGARDPGSLFPWNHEMNLRWPGVSAVLYICSANTNHSGSGLAGEPTRSSNFSTRRMAVRKRESGEREEERGTRKTEKRKGKKKGRKKKKNLERSKCRQGKEEAEREQLHGEVQHWGKTRSAPSSPPSPPPFADNKTSRSMDMKKLTNRS